MNRNKIAGMIVAISTTCIVAAHTDKVYATEHKNSNNHLEQQSQVKAVKKGQVINVSSNLRIRTSPSTSSNVLGYLTNGTVFNIDGKEGHWYKINANGKIGYIHEDYVKEINGGTSNGGNSSNGDSSLDTSLSGKIGKVVNVSTHLRVRSGASTSSSVVSSLRAGQTFTIKGKSGAWYKINTDGITGYVYEEYVKVISGEVSGGNNNNNSGNSNLDTSQSGKTGKVINVSTYLRVRSEASTSSSVIGSLKNGQNFKIKGKNGDWYYIDANGTSGYVYKDYVQILNGNEDNNNSGNTENYQDSIDESYNGKTGQVINVTTSLRFRSEPSKRGSVLGYLSENERVALKGKTSNGWFKISHNGKFGYVSGEYIKVIASDSGSSNENTGGNESGHEVNQSKYEKVLSVMKAQIGSPYIYGGSGQIITNSLLNDLRHSFPDHAARGFYDIHSRYLNGNYRAFDCSGLMQWSFAQVGVSLGRTTWDQVNSGIEVSPREAKPGDLLFFNGLGHVGMYIGNGQWIEAPNKGKTVSISPVPWSRIGRARRVL